MVIDSVRPSRLSQSMESRVAWLAGIFDGEGFIDVRIQKAPYASTHSKAGCKYDNLQLRAGLTNTDLPMIIEVEAVMNTLGVTANSYARQPKVSKHKPYWEIFYGGGKRLSAFLQPLLPFLITKRERAELALRAIERRGQLGYWIGNDEGLFFLVSEVQRLNRRGV